MSGGATAASRSSFMTLEHVRAFRLDNCDRKKIAEPKTRTAMAAGASNVMTMANALGTSWLGLRIGEAPFEDT